MGSRSLGRRSLVQNDSKEDQFVSNSIPSGQLLNDPEDAQSITAQTRVGMLKNRYNRLAKRYNFSFITGDEIISSVSLIEVD